MITGLRITMRGEDLSLRISERIRVHEATLSALDTRIKNREGDQWFDVRVEDGMETLGELESEREHFRGRVLRLTLLRDGLAADEIYALGSADLRLADLIPNDCPDVSTMPEERCVADRRTMAIDGLKLTISGHELRRLLEQRMRDHARRAERWRAEQARTPEQETDDQPLLPDHICDNEAERSDWRGSVLGFIRDHVEAVGVYRLGERDLAFGDLLPEKPGWLEQEEYEERTSVGFQLERLTKRLGELPPLDFAFATRQAGGDDVTGADRDA